MTATLWAFLPHDTAEEPRAFVCSEAGDILRSGPIARCAGGDVSRVVAVIAGVDITLARLNILQGTPVQMQMAAKLMMRDLVVGGDGPAAAAVSPQVGADGLRWAALFDLDVSQAAIEMLAAFDLEVDAVVPAALLLEAPPQGAVRAPYLGVDIALTPARGFAAEPAVMDYILGKESAVEQVPNDALEACFQAAAQRPLPLNMLVGALAKTDGSALNARWFKRSAVLAAIAAVIIPALPMIEAAKYRAATEDLDVQTLALVKQALPNAPRIVNARAQLEERMSALGLSGGAERLLASLAQGVAAQGGVVVEALTYDQRQGLAATLIISNEAQLDQLVGRLRTQSVTVDASAIRSTSDGPRAQLTMRAGA